MCLTSICQYIITFNLKEVEEKKLWSKRLEFPDPFRESFVTLQFMKTMRRGDKNRYHLISTSEQKDK